ncbi:MAG: hypothetical protein J5674_05725 [Candidatus Methanomethylophilaceae archaeon]|nr:hypothetical protein [Candidatus Methanomethylophilaceae archaeon]
MLSLTISVDYGDEGLARAVMDALGPDNGGYVESSLDGGTLTLRMESESAGALRNTMDDLMACLKAAEDAIGAGRRPIQLIS